MYNMCATWWLKKFNPMSNRLGFSFLTHRGSISSKSCNAWHALQGIYAEQVLLLTEDLQKLSTTQMLNNACYVSAGHV